MFTIRIADTLIRIENQYQFIEDYCRNYIVKDVQSDFTVAVSDADIMAERSGQCSGHSDYLEILAVYRKICEKLIDRGIVLFHASALMIDNEAVLFAAPSGTGKSTHARIWRETFGGRVTMINDDKPLIAIKNASASVNGSANDGVSASVNGSANDGVNDSINNSVSDSTQNSAKCIVYGTPWCGKHGLENNISAPLSAVFWVKRGTDNVVTSPDNRSAFAHVLNQIYRPNDEALMRKTLLLAGKLLENVKFFEITCNMEKEAAVAAYNAVFGK